MSPAEVRTQILRKLQSCRGQRAFAASLLSCIHDEPRTERRLHNICVVLFRQGLIERQRGMYWLTTAGQAEVGATHGK